MIYLIIGRTGTGKSYLGEKLKNKGLSPLKSYTTRPKRNTQEQTYTFTDERQANLYDDKIATTVIDGYQYFSRKHQIDESDFYIIDPNGAYKLFNNKPDTNFHIIYICGNEDQRKQYAINRADDKKLAKKVFISRDKDEKQQFDQFENKLELIKQKKAGIFPDNVGMIYTVQNDYQDNTLEGWATFLYQSRNLFYSIIRLTKLAIKNNLLITNSIGNIQVNIQKNNDENEYLPVQFFADLLLARHDELSEFLIKVLEHCDLSDIE